MVLETNYGSIKIALDAAAAPKTSANFAKLAADKFYDGLTFHRVIPGFIVQGGDPAGDGTGGPGYELPAEIKLPHKRGAVASARLPDEVNPNRNSSGSQFYIALKDLSELDGQYTVFGMVTEGLDVVDKIAAVKTDSSDKPLEAVIINKVYAE
ncbi:MAG: peptidylprolyl isomerase [Candidatus Doudnabacteria bacterium]|nr:peptidylprolyl isomerase [Candidatus Doudnabacteria bacterium]